MLALGYLPMTCSYNCSMCVDIYVSVHNNSLDHSMLIKDTEIVPSNVTCSWLEIIIAWHFGTNFVCLSSADM